LGGWLVLEPWITPSLFYQFLGKDRTGVAMDLWGFCSVLGAEEGNRQLTRHWDTWVTDAHLTELSARGVNSVRLPVGDWIFEPYGPYVGCTDGALAKVDWVVAAAATHGLSVLLDIHGVRGSQNGFDNSGRAGDVAWTSLGSTQAIGVATFEHWPVRSAEWVGSFDRDEATYTEVNYGNLNMTLRVIEAIALRYANSPSVLGLEPVNEPWQFTPLDVLKSFYWQGYLVVKRVAPSWRFVMHDSFRFTPEAWGGFMRGCPDIVLDTHIYQAWRDPSNKESFYVDACQAKNQISVMERSFGPVVVGEWSLASDNCAMWLNGFNDNMPGFPKLPCKYTPCPKPYMNDDNGDDDDDDDGDLDGGGSGFRDGSGFIQPGAPPDPTKPLQQPYGTGVSGPVFGLCPTDIDWVDGNGQVGGGGSVSGGLPRNSKGGNAEAEAAAAAKLYDSTVTLSLAHKKLHAWSTASHGFYFWNFRAEVSDRWDFLASSKLGWVPDNLADLDAKVATACVNEDNGIYLCEARRGIFASTTKEGLGYVCAQEYPSNSNNPTDDDPLQQCTDSFSALTGQALLSFADVKFNGYWATHRTEGVTCDFGGAAELQSKRTNTTMATAKDDDGDDSESVETSLKGSLGPSHYVANTAMAIVFFAAAAAVFLFSCGSAAKKKTTKTARDDETQPPKHQRGGGGAYQQVELSSSLSAIPTTVARTMQPKTENNLPVGGNGGEPHGSGGALFWGKPSGYSQIV